MTRRSQQRKPLKQPGDIFTKRGISPEVRESRGYIPYGPDNFEPVEEAYRDLSESQRKFVRKVARQSEGYLIKRYVPPGLDLPPIYPEIRPSNRVKTRNARFHWHGDDPSQEPPGLGYKREPKPKDGEWSPPTDLEKRNIHTAKSMRRHIDRDRGFDDDHRGQNTNAIHSHADKVMAKYVHPPGNKDHCKWTHDHYEKRWRHEHYAYKTARGRKKHLHKWHDGKDISGWHQHISPVNRDAKKLEEHERKYHDGKKDVRGFHKHTRDIIDPNNPIARRIDMQPWAAPLFENTRQVFFGIEGCIKADSMLVFILKTGYDASVLSVPAVGQWNAPELEKVVRRYLRGKRVFVVPDSDWREKGKEAVVGQAFLCSETLRRYGVEEVYVAAPPVELYHTTKGADDEIKGVDDFLGAGYSLDEMHVVERRMPEALLKWKDRQIKGGRRGRWREGLERDAEVLQALALFAGTDGEVHATLRMLAKVLYGDERQKCKVRRVLINLEERGAVTFPEGGLRQRQNYYTERTEWCETPTVIVAEELRCDEVLYPLSELNNCSKGQEAA